MSKRDIARKALPGRSALLGAVSLGVLGQGAQVALLATSAWLITRAAEQPPILYLTFAIVAVRAFAIGRASFRYVERVVSHESAFRALAELRVWMYRRLVRLAPAGLQRVGRGSVLASVVRDVDTLQDYPLRVIQPLTTALTVVTLSVVGLSLIDLRAAGMLLLTLVIAGLLAVWWNSTISAVSDRLVGPLRAQMADRIIDTVQRRAVLVAYGAEAEAEEAIVEVDGELEQAERKVALGQHLVGGLAVLFSGVTVAFIAWVTMDRVGAGELTGPLFALLVLTPLAVFEVFAAVPLAFSALRGVDVASERISTLVPDQIPPGIPQEREDGSASVGPAPHVTSLEIRDMQAKWPAMSDYPTQPIDLSLRSGDIALMTGPSGVGKSTIASALAGFIDYRGEVLIDGESIEQMSLGQRRQWMVLIEQVPHLFDTTLRHNLSFANPHVSDDQVWDALKRVGLGEWARERGGLDVEVGESGALVSGGQAQRIALARAFLATSPIIVLDEPTANVDRAVADQLMDDLLRSIQRDKDSIAIVISHVPVNEELVSTRVRVVENS
jgi:ATP-binding cassette subfamily C protein CydC